MQILNILSIHLPDKEIIVLFCFAQDWASGWLIFEKYLTCSLEGHFVNLTIALDYVHRFSFVVGEGCDSLGALTPVHCNSATVESFNKDDGLVGGHKESIGECLVVKCLAPLIKMADPLLSSSQSGLHHPMSGLC